MWNKTICETASSQWVVNFLRFKMEKSISNLYYWRKWKVDWWFPVTSFLGSQSGRHQTHLDIAQTCFGLLRPNSGLDFQSIQLSTQRHNTLVKLVGTRLLHVNKELSILYSFGHTDVLYGETLFPITFSGKTNLASRNYVGTKHCCDDIVCLSHKLDEGNPHLAICESGVEIFNPAVK